MKTAVIYARYSAGPNQTEQSIEGQLRDCYAFAEKNGFHVVGEYIDRKISGRTDNRREFQRMIEDSGKKMFETVIMYQTDRFARNRYDSAVYKHILRKNGVELKYAVTNIPSGPEGIILESLMEGLAEYYSAELSQKIKRGMRESALKCHSTGAGHCLGYKTGPDKKFIIDEEGAKAVRTVFDMYIAGKRNVEICDYLNGLGLRTAHGNLFNKNSVSHIIKNKRYIGVYRYGDIIIEDGIPAIVSKDTFQLAQKELARRRTHKMPKVPKAEYLLSGKAFCGYCGKPMIGVSGTGKGGNKWYYYYCAGSRGRDKTCRKKPVKRNWLEDTVVKMTVENILQPEIITQIGKECYALQLEYLKENSEVKFFEDKIAEVKKAIRNISKSIESGIITKTLPARLAELEKEQEQLESELVYAKAQDFVVTPAQIEFLVSQFVEPLEDESWDAYKKRIIKSFVNKVFVFDDKLLIHYNITRPGDGREMSQETLYAQSKHIFDSGTSKSTTKQTC